jgi:hypothetical protein
MSPGLRSSEFKVALLTVLGSILAANQSWVSDPTGTKLSVGAAIAYVVSRGLAKLETRGPEGP